MPDRPATSTAFRDAANAKHSKVIADREHWRTCGECFQLCRLGRPCPCPVHLELEPLGGAESHARRGAMRAPGKVPSVDPGAV